MNSQDVISNDAFNQTWLFSRVICWTHSNIDMNPMLMHLKPTLKKVTEIIEQIKGFG